MCVCECVCVCDCKVIVSLNETGSHFRILQKHSVAYQSVYDKKKEIINSCSLPHAEIKTEALKITGSFLCDFSCVFVEIVQFAAFANFKSYLIPSQQAVFLQDEGLLDIFLGGNVTLRVYLSMMFTCSEKSCSSN